MRSLMLMAAFAAVAAVSAADVCYEGRWLDAQGDVQRNATVSAVLAAYESEAATEPLDSKSVTIATDDDGCFAVSAKGLAVPQELQVFWIGVTPDGGTEIRPRMRVNPAPFALVAAAAKRVDTKSATLSGYTKVDSLQGIGSGSPCEVVASNVTLTGATTLKGDMVGAGVVYLGGMDLAGGGLDMMNTESKDNISTMWDSFAADEEIELVQPSIFFFPTYEEGEVAITAEADAIAMVMIRVDSGSDLNRTYAWLENGDFTVLNETIIRDTRSGARLFTFPVRRGKTLYLRLVNKCEWLIDLKSWAKVKMVYIGRRN